MMMMMTTLLLACSESESAAPMVASPWLVELFEWPGPLFMIGGVIAVVAILAGTITKVTVTRAREQTRREIAAYVAEGTIDPDKGIEMLKAGETSDDDD